MDLISKTVVCFELLLHIITLAKAHLISLDSPPVVRPVIFVQPPLNPVMNPLYSSKYFSPQGNLGQYSPPGFPNIAKYGGFQFNPPGPPGYIVGKPPASSKFVPLNPSSVYLQNNPQFIQRNKYMRVPVEVSRVALTDTDDDEDSSISQEMLPTLQDEAMIIAGPIFHQVDVRNYQTSLQTAPPFYLYPSVKVTDRQMIPSDIMFVIYTSQSLGYVQPNGKAAWHNGVIDFMNQFIRTSVLGPDKTRIGAVIVGHEGVEGLIPMLTNPAYLVDSLTHSKSSFRGLCTDKGLLVAKNMFYQYGRPYAAKRIILITDDTLGCSFMSMPGMLLVRECGVDVIHVKFGAYQKGLIKGIPPDLRPYWTLPIKGNIDKYMKSITDRIYKVPLDGGWSHWSRWNRCSGYQTCNVGYQMRFRICDNPRPKYGGRACGGPSTDRRFCRMKHCKKYQSGYWTPWSPFSLCSSDCGPGTRTRTRMCLTFNGKPSMICAGNYVQTRDCLVNECPVDGGWSLWTGWGLCSTPCGSGIRVRTRVCDGPFPRNGGRLCSGRSLEETVCRTGIPCPIPGGFGPWEKLDRCDVPCGRGYQQYIRRCDNPLPQYGGQHCIGRFVMKRPCDTGITCPIQVQWGSWTPFTHCSVTCGSGVRRRRRSCNSSVSKYPEAQCTGPSVEESICNTGIDCPINGGWSHWIDDPLCSVDCGKGQRQRTRYCNNPAPLNCGMACLGSPTDTIPCVAGKQCVVDGGWGPWSEFSRCSVKCGEGVEVRSRKCNNPTPKGGAYCVGLPRDQRICKTNIICDGTGLWSNWLPWEFCSAECGSGIRKRQRLCSNPLNVPGGESSCGADPLQTEVCDSGVPCPVHGGWSNWVDTGPCSVSCGTGFIKRIRACNSPTPSYGGNTCLGPNEEFIKCNRGSECPINGGWTFWGNWGPCVGKCGMGSQRRIRSCENPAPMHLGSDCIGDHFEERQCETITPCPVDGFWSPWSPWSNCLTDCGPGFKTKFRKCDAPKPMYGGKNCNGVEKEETKCSSEIKCPIDGGWGSWSPFTPCSVSCGTGVMKRSRSCDKPVPLHKGKPCIGHSKENIVCNTEIECPVHGGWSPWTNYSPCSVSCGSGFKERKRECSSPYPMFDGKPCIGDAVERTNCQAPLPCPVHGQWSDWTQFSPCDVPCGSGVKRRKRICNSPEPRYGGNYCPGVSINEVICNAPVQCPIDGGWSAWTQYSVCSVTCGVGLQVRKRLCNDPPPLYNGASCFGGPMEERECTNGPCPINGGWTNWSGFGPCSATCGKGMKRRSRDCANPFPNYGGLLCEGPSFEDVPCSAKTECPIDGGWSPWFKWSLCSSPCGAGRSERVRTCSNPPALYGGKPCPGPGREEMVCETGIMCPIDGNWGPWGVYTPCSKHCGGGVAQRHRVCDSPVPQYKGKDCLGPNIESIKCNVDIPCPVDGGFSYWTKWSPCSVKCGAGTQLRSRLCNSPAPLHGGKPCVGRFNDERTCMADTACPVDGQWGSWTPFTPCSGSCGLGTRERARTCDNPVPLYGGSICNGKDIDVQECYIGKPCAVDGQWNIWAPWSDCSETCDMGVQRRARLCSNPKPMYGGKSCIGEKNQDKLCNTGISCPVNGNWGHWTEWMPCSAKCGEGLKTRVRQCDNPAAQYGGMSCGSENKQQSKCDSGVPCPVDGMWAFWSEWTLCSTSCGPGIRERHRTCSNPAPVYGGLRCDGPANEMKECNLGTNCPVHGHWTPWSPWSSCSVTCGPGSQSRVRECADPIPAYGGTPCKGNDVESKECFSKCPIHGQWSPWENYGPCSSTCGIGIKRRIRSCTNPIPAYSGHSCIGPVTDTIDCTMPNCPIHGNWSPWHSWSPCQGTCGIGITVRLRECNDPFPAFGGKTCPDSDQETAECKTKIPCPVDGQWSPWNTWSPCQGTCGMGITVRLRECNKPIPAFGGRICSGSDHETAECKTNNPCPVDGQWSPWTDWSACQGTCGMGIIIRLRDCNNPLPVYGGKKCPGLDHETAECKTNIPCPVDGQWSPWNSWSRCQGTCGMGITVRLRECNNPMPAYSGKVCTGIDHETAECKTNIPCPVDGQWSPWTQWSGCTNTCGKGQRTRLRVCDNPVPSYDGRKCIGPEKDHAECDTKVPCPIHGNWAGWSQWSNCDAECGVGSQMKTRLCKNPSPKYGGKRCVGHRKESRDCDSGKPCSVDGGWTSWNSWSACDKPCGIGRQVRLRTCSNPRPKFNGQLCPGVPEDSRPCGADNPCKVLGKWSPWMPWSICSMDCGTGTQTRVRQCKLALPSKYEIICPGIGEEQRSCKSIEGCAVDGDWSSWEVWSDCSVTCGQGFTYRYRRCDSPIPKNGGMICLGQKEESSDCDTKTPCSRPGGWSSWEAWTECSTSCGTGVQYRARRCTSPMPIGRGMDCEGWPEDNQVCNTEKACPIHGQWSVWTEFGPCTADCSAGAANNRGTRTRRRFCDSPQARNGGDPCFGSALDVQGCTDFPPCVVPVWRPWGKWSTCSQECGPGISERKRQCVDSNSGMPSSGCVGIDVQSVACLERPCPTIDVNCSTECKWDNGIGYAPYPGDCSMFIQCDSLYGEPRVHKCPHGLLWSLGILQCVFPEQSECDLCTSVPDGTVLSYFLTCKSYWECNNNLPVAKCCPDGHRFDDNIKKCVPDPTEICTDSCPPVKETIQAPTHTECLFKESALGGSWYEQKIAGVWQPRPCGIGTVYSSTTCGCIAAANATETWQKKVCEPELHLMFDTQQQDLDRNIGIHMENVTYLGDGTAYFDGSSAINSNIFSNSEWGKDVYVYIRFKPEGKGDNQGLVHNSGCGPSDIGPSVFIGIDRSPQLGPDKMMMKFAAVPRARGLKYEFVNITTPDNKLVDAWFKFGDGHFRAEVDGLVAELQLPGRPVARRHGALNIGGNLCRIGNEAFRGFEGILDEVRIYKCKPPR